MVAHPRLARSVAVTETVIHSFNKLSTYYVSALWFGVRDSMVNKVAVAPVLKQSASLLITKLYLGPLHDMISLLDFWLL